MFRKLYTVSLGLIQSTIEILRRVVQIIRKDEAYFLVEPSKNYNTILKMISNNFNKIVEYEESDFFENHKITKFISSKKIILDESSYCLIKDSMMITKKWTFKNYMRLDFVVVDCILKTSLPFEYSSVQSNLFEDIFNYSGDQNTLHYMKLRLVALVQNSLLKNNGRFGIMQYKYFKDLNSLIKLELDVSKKIFSKFLELENYFPNYESISFISRNNKYIRKTYMPVQFKLIQNLEYLLIVLVMNKICVESEILEIEESFKLIDYIVENYILLDETNSKLIMKISRGGNFKDFGRPKSMIVLKSYSIQYRSNFHTFNFSRHPGVEDPRLALIKTQLRERLDIKIHSTDNTIQSLQLLDQMNFPQNY